MSSPTSEPVDGMPQKPESGGVNVMLLASLFVSSLILIWYFGIAERYGTNRDNSALGWLKAAWNPENDYEHGPLVPLVVVGLIAYSFKKLRASVSQGSMWGLAVIFIGVVFYAAGYRALQPRITVGSLPFILWGASLYLWGWRSARLLLFPLFFFWLAVPLPSFQQATTHLQLLATSMAQHGASLFGVQTYVEGTTILPANGNWKPLEIAAGCSGIRSLMALLMISAAWAYIAKIALWKKVLLFFMAFPLAILGNALRVISIFVIAEYGDAEWASTTWHDWSGLLFFYPFSLALLLLTHSILEGGLPWKKWSQRKLRRTVVSKTYIQQA